MQLENWICDMAKGDKEGLRQFYEETARPVYSFIFSVLKDPHESEDVMQETFLAVWEHAGEYVPYGKPLAWVFTIAKRLCYMRLREKKRQEVWEDHGYRATAATAGADGRMDSSFRCIGSVK